jgi:hypothetical protein
VTDGGRARRSWTRPLGRSIGSIGLLLALCALPAHGHESALPTEILYALTPIDRSPTREDLAILGAPPAALAALRDYATEQTVGGETDFGAQLRAIRAIPQYCPEEASQCRSELTTVLDDIAGDTEETEGQKLLRKRAAIEALGVARSGQPEDLTVLTGFLADPSRDIRLAAVRAFRDLCDPAALSILAQRSDPVEQVRVAILEAVEVLRTCGQ